MKVQYREKKRMKFRISFVFLFIILSFSICFVLYMKNDDVDFLKNITFLDKLNFFKSDDEPAEPVFIETNEDNKVVIANPITKSAAKSSDYYNESLFIGGFELKGLSDYGLIPNDRAVSNSDFSILTFDTGLVTYSGTQKDALSIINEVKPKALYLMLDLNEITLTTDDTYFSKYGEFVDKILQGNDGIMIYIVSTLPVTADIESDAISNTLIDECNSKLLSFAKEKNICFLDVNTEFKGNDGKLPGSDAESHTSRLKKEAYERLSDYILTHVYSE